MRRTAFACVGLLWIFAGAPAADPPVTSPADVPAVRIPEGFTISLVADHHLVNDIFTFCLDERARIVVSGKGYVRRLIDSDGDGRADRAVDLVKTKTGAMGLCFYPNAESAKHDLYVSADGGIHRFARIDDDRFADPQPVLTGLSNGEHGVHALKIGPDRRLWAIGGNDAGWSKLKPGPGSIVPKAQAGALIRFMDLSKGTFEVMGHGWRNPYDFDFTNDGDAVTYDSDTERDHLLPWYMPTRAYRVQPGMHHGWRLPGYMQSLARRDDYCDTQPMLADMGRGSPTGVCSYLADQFPKQYHGGVFLLDWTFGRIHFLPRGSDDFFREPRKPQVFLEPKGTDGFAPTAARVAPDGSLLVSIGGRGTRGAIYRIAYKDSKGRQQADEAIHVALKAPQFREAWSRIGPGLAADRAGADELLKVTRSDDNGDVDVRLRAMELLGGRRIDLAVEAVDRLAADPNVRIRAKSVWLIGEQTTDRHEATLLKLSKDPSPEVRLKAMTTLLGRLRSGRQVNPLEVMVAAVTRGLSDHDRRVRAQSALVYALLAPPDRRSVDKVVADPRGLVGVVMGRRFADPPEYAIDFAVRAVEAARTDDDRLDAVRAVMIALGDWDLAYRTPEAFAAYTLPEFAKLSDADRRILLRAMPAVRRGLHAPHRRLREESLRLSAMLEDDLPDTLTNGLDLLSAAAEPTDEIHVLMALLRLKSTWTEKQATKAVDALLGLDGKLEGRNLRIKQNWAARIGEMTIEVMRKHPSAANVIAAHRDLLRPGNSAIVVTLTGQAQRTAAERLRKNLADDPDAVCSPEVVCFLTVLPAADLKPVLRSRWSDLVIRDAGVGILAQSAEETDRGRLLECLETGNDSAVRIAAKAIQTLPPSRTSKDLIPVLRRLHRSLSDPKEAEIRRALVLLASRSAERAFDIRESGTDRSALEKAYAPIFDWFEKAHPTEAKGLRSGSTDVGDLDARLNEVKWDGGSAERGRKVFRDRGCQACHESSSRVGPDLNGSAGRFSRRDLFVAIVDPSRDIPTGFQTIQVDTKDGKRVNGILIFESADGVMVQTGPAEMKRIATEDMESRRPGTKSLMPEGLLRGLKPEDWADLYAYLRSLTAK